MHSDQDHGTTGQPVDELAKLRADYPGWRFGTHHVEAANGPGDFRYWARSGNILLSKESPDELRFWIEREETGW